MATYYQSGIPSAAGLCLESTWGTAPLSTGGGYTRVIGVTNTNPHRFWIVDPGGGFPAKATLEFPHDEIDGSVELKRTILTEKLYQGEFGFKGDSENLYYPLLGMFGRDIETIIGGGAYAHKFLPGKYAPSFTLEEILGDATYARVSTGLIITRLELTFGKVLTCRMSGYAQHQAPNSYLDANNNLVDYSFGSAASFVPKPMGGDGNITWARTASPTYVDVAQGKNGNGPLVFAGLNFGNQFGSYFLTVDDQPITNITLLEGCTLVLDRSVDFRQTAGSGFDIGACIGNQFAVSGNLMALFQDQTIQKAAMKRSKVGLNFKLTGNLIAGTTNYGLDVYVPWLNFTEDGLKIPGGALLVNGPWTARQDPTLGYSAQVTLWNTVDNTLLGGTQGSSPGGMGGWQSS